MSRTTITTISALRAEVETLRAEARLPGRSAGEIDRREAARAALPDAEARWAEAKKAEIRRREAVGRESARTAKNQNLQRASALEDVLAGYLPANRARAVARARLPEARAAK